MNFFTDILNKKITTIISIILNVVLIIISSIFAYLILTNKSACNMETPNDAVSYQDNENVEEKFYVDIKGEVKKPGVYEITSSNIINDVIKLAGGFTKNAYKNNINLSKKVTNELVIYVYSKSEYKKKLNKTNAEVTQSVCETSTYDTNNCTQNTLASEIIASDKDTVTNQSNTNKTEDTSNMLININTASVSELTKLSGIGDSKANDIINYRNTNGLFKTIDDIKNVSGIGDALFNKIKDKITV